MKITKYFFVFLLILNQKSFAQTGEPEVFNHISIGSGEYLKNYLQNHNSEVNARRADHSTPLMVAASYDFTDCVSVLLDFGADPNLQDYGGNVALDYALERIGDQAATIRLLLKGHADLRKVSHYFPQGVVSLRDSSLVTDLAKLGVHFADYSNEDGNILSAIVADYNCTFDEKSLSVLKVLIDLNVDPNGTDSVGKGLTPLMAAASCGNAAIPAVLPLVKAGAELNRKDAQGETALKKAVTPEMKNLLISLGATE